ncbi:cytochrome c [Inquilinus limosus]|uniref:c-type cytochrome n=1 Tax=Inquilinus limosus TaxID=171674 RepID=UPI003F17D1A0
MRLLSFAAVTAAIVSCGSVVAWATTPEEAVAKREDAMKTFGAGVKALTGFVRDNQGTIDDVKAATGKMAGVSAELLALFPEGTAVGVGESAAKPEIWTNWADFQAKVKSTQDAIAALDAAAQAGDAVKVKAAFPAVGQACGACHETYRVKKS